MKPYKDFVVLKPRDSETMVGSIIIPENARKESQRATVIAVGPGKEDDYGNFIPMEVSPGDEVLFGKYAGVDLERDGENFKIVRELEILAVLD